MSGAASRAAWACLRLGLGGRDDGRALERLVAVVRVEPRVVGLVGLVGALASPAEQPALAGGASISATAVCPALMTSGASSSASVSSAGVAVVAREPVVDAAQPRDDLVHGRRGDHEDAEEREQDQQRDGHARA